MQHQLWLTLDTYSHTTRRQHSHSSRTRQAQNSEMTAAACKQSTGQLVQHRCMRCEFCARRGWEVWSARYQSRQREGLRLSSCRILSLVFLFLRIQQALKQYPVRLGGMINKRRLVFDLIELQLHMSTPVPCSNCSSPQAVQAPNFNYLPTSD